MMEVPALSSHRDTVFHTVSHISVENSGQNQLRVSNFELATRHSQSTTDFGIAEFCYEIGKRIIQQLRQTFEKWVGPDIGRRASYGPIR
jgi:hypothetical protein